MKAYENTLEVYTLQTWNARKQDKKARVGLPFTVDENALMKIGAQ